MKGFIRTREGRDGKRYQVLVTVDGHKRSLGTFKLKKDAEARLKRAEAELANGTFGREVNVTFSELAATWLESIKLDVKPSAYSDYEIQARKHLNPFFGEKRIDRITPADVDKYRTAKAGETKKDGNPYSSRRVNKSLVTLGAIFRYAVENGYLIQSPTRFMKKVKEEHREMDFLNPEEVRRLLDACSPDFYPIAFTAITTGLRQGELFGLRWSDVDIEKKIIRVNRSYHPSHGFTSPKSRQGERSVLITPDLAEVLIVHRAKSGGGPDDLVFSNKAGNPIDYHNIEKREFHKALDQAGLRHIRFHDLRHTHAALMVANPKVNVKFLQRQMGHADIGTTLNTYGHLIPEVSNGIGEQLDAMIYPEGLKVPSGVLVRIK